MELVLGLSFAMFLILVILVLRLAPGEIFPLEEFAKLARLLQILLAPGLTIPAFHLPVVPHVLTPRLLLVPQEL